jgi:hypothetical protein
MHPVQNAAKAEAGRLLRVLFLRIGRLPPDPRAARLLPARPSNLVDSSMTVRLSAHSTFNPYRVLPASMSFTLAEKTLLSSGGNFVLSKPGN